MKKFNSILNDIKTTTTAIEDIKEHNRTSKYSDYISSEDQQLKRDILYNNARYVLYNNIIDQIASIWNKYTGKQYGSKTRDKIYNEIKSACNVAFYIKHDLIYSTEASITPLSNAGYTIDYTLTIKLYINNYQLINDNNTIQALNINDIQLSNTINYINNIDSYINKLKNLYNDYKKAERQARAIASRYNDLKTLNMNAIDPYNTFNTKSYLI